MYGFITLSMRNHLIKILLSVSYSLQSIGNVFKMLFLTFTLQFEKSSKKLYISNGNLHATNHRVNIDPTGVRRTNNYDYGCIINFHLMWKFQVVFILNGFTKTFQVSTYGPTHTLFDKIHNYPAFK